MRLDASGSGASQQVKIYLDRVPDAMTLKPVNAIVDPSDEPPLLTPLSVALTKEPAAPSPEQRAAWVDQWGVLGKLAPRVYLTKGAKPRWFQDTCWMVETDHCFVTVWWHRPGLVLVRSWYSDTGSLVASDAIVPTGAPGVFKVRRRYAGRAERAEFEIVATRDQLIEDGIRMTLTEATPAQSWPVDDVAHSLLTPEVATARGFASTKRATAATETLAQVAYRERVREDEERGRRQAQRAQTMAAIYQGLQAAGQILEEGRRDSQARLDASIANAQAQGAPGHGAAQQQAVSLARRIAQGAQPNAPAPTYAPPPQAPAQPAFQPSNSPESSCSYWHRHRAGDREYEQCSPGDENCTCADAAKVSGQ
jgi:hypothetical protein